MPKQTGRQSAPRDARYGVLDDPVSGSDETIVLPAPYDETVSAPTLEHHQARSAYVSDRRRTHSHPHLAHPDLHEAHTTRRRTTTARPLRAEDRALVERTTQVLRALEIAETHQMQALQASRDTRHSITLVPAPQSRLTAPALPIPRRTHPRGPLVTAVIWSLALVTIIGVLHTVSAAGTATNTPRFTPLAARFGDNAAAYGPWATGDGAADVLGLGGGAGPGVTAPGSAGLPVTTKSAPTPAPAQRVAPTPAPKPPAPTVLPAPFQPWPPADPYMYVPGHPAFAVQNPTNYYPVAWGQCTWWAQWNRRDEYLQHMGNAMYWLGGAAARGYRTGTVPVAGATVVLQPGVQGASGVGHVAHVEAVYPGGWFLVSEMNFYWNGGGWGRVSYRYMHSGPGVGFIY